MKPNVLIVAAPPHLAETLAASLTPACSVIAAPVTLIRAMIALRKTSVQAVLLWDSAASQERSDLLGRAQQLNIPVIALCPQLTPTVVVPLLEGGASDVVAAHVDPRELRARLTAALRRSASRSFSGPPVVLNREDRIQIMHNSLLTCDGEAITADLTPAEVAAKQAIGVAVAPSTSGPDLDRLTLLAQLRRDGMLTEAEFTR